MKKIFYLLVVAAMVMVSCQHATKTVPPVDLEAEKAAIKDVFDKFHAAYFNGDAVTMATFLADDALFMGTDPSEFWNKQQFTELWAQTFAEAVPELHFIGEIEIKLAADGHSATVISQYVMPDMLPGIPFRNAYHVVKIDDRWMMLVLNAALIPYNEDVPKILEALQ